MTRSPIPGTPVGWPLLPLPDAAGRLRFPTVEESIRERIEVILRTRPGEQLMRPRFGGGLENFVHEPNTITTRRRIRDIITESLNRWETRILLDRVDVLEAPDRPSHVHVEIAYRLRRTGAPADLRLSVALEG